MPFSELAAPTRFGGCGTAERAAHEGAPVDEHFAVRERAGAVELVRGEQHRATTHRDVVQQAVEQGAAVGVETGVGFVEEQQVDVAHERGGEREPAALAGREIGVADPGHRVEAEPLERDVDGCRVVACGAHREAQVFAA